jgi:two-component system, OmpR family, response regulator
MNELQRVLYVEDEPDIRAVAQVALETIGGLTLLCCSSGEEAIQRGAAFEPEMILLDVMMPGMDGPTTLRALRALPGLAQVPVAFMTAKVQPQEVEHYKSLGARDVIAKPFDPMALAVQVRSIWGSERV